MLRIEFNRPLTGTRINIRKIREIGNISNQLADLSKQPFSGPTGLEKQFSLGSKYKEPFSKFLERSMSKFNDEE